MVMTALNVDRGVRRQCARRDFEGQIHSPTGLRGCLTRCNSGQAANHEMDHRYLDKGYTGFRQEFVIFTQAPVAIEPPEGALDNPPFRDHDEALGLVRTLGDLQTDRPPGS
jgi:hypothetical protein